MQDITEHNITEDELQNKLAKYLARYFYVEREIWSTNGKRRIDLAMIHKSDTERKYPIGIEIKTFNKKTGADAGKWLKQAWTYSELDFIGYGRMLIIVAPQFSENVFSEGKLMHKHVQNDSATQDHNVATFLCQFNIGEFQRYNRENYITHTTQRLSRIVFNGLIIWDERGDTFRPKNIKRNAKSNDIS
jgi:hypothetical protein